MIVEISCRPTGHGNVILLPPYSSASHISLIGHPPPPFFFHFHYCHPAPSQAPPSVPASFCGAVPVPLLCVPSNCLSNMPELFNTLSSPLLHFLGLKHQISKQADENDRKKQSIPSWLQFIIKSLDETVSVSLRLGLLQRLLQLQLVITVCL